MRRLILGTAGHIDHGKTALVQALTGIDTDRLSEEKERGITIDLGFAELAGEDLQLGVVDVPGHEGFIRNMLAGATGVDVVLLVVAADEGVMPQTREHLAIIRLLGIRSLVVALTKVDLVEEAWLELVREEVTEVLLEHGFVDAPILSTSARTRHGVDELAETLRNAAAPGTDGGREADLARLPVDRAFTVKGTGTVVTGTLWSGRLRTGQQVWLRPAGSPDASTVTRRSAVERMPEGLEARIRGMQVHGRDVEEAVAGERTAVALGGGDVDLQAVGRGQTLLSLESWPETWMITLRAEVLPDTGWGLAHNQRVRVHAGTAEVMGRVVLLGRSEPLEPGEVGWVQLRLEAPVVVRARERLVLRSYSPMTTIGGGVVVEPLAPKRRRLPRQVAERLEGLLADDPETRVRSVLELAGWEGVPRPLVPVLAGVRQNEGMELLDGLEKDGARQAGARMVASSCVADARHGLLERVRAYHRDEPLRPGVPPEVLREVLPDRAPAGLADLLLEELQREGHLETRNGTLADPGHRTRLNEDQQTLRARLHETLQQAGLAPPAVQELPGELAEHPDLWPILRLLESEGRVTSLDEGLFISAEHLARAVRAVRSELAGRTGLGPTDFKDVLPVSRKHLIPLLIWMDRSGVTLRSRTGRDVPAEPLPDDTLPPRGTSDPGDPRSASGGTPAS